MAASIATALGLVFAFLGPPVATAAAATFTWSPQASEISVTPPSNAGSEPKAFSWWGACPTTSFCVGVGEYTDNAGHKEAMTAARTNGTWGPASEITLPSNAASNPEASLGSGACTQSGSCAAFGSYTDSSGGRDLMATDETSGSWGPASEIALPANASSTPYAFLHPVCPPSGSCVAVGDYEATSGHEAMTATESGGSWGPASEIALPSNAASNPEAYLTSVACQATGSCFAVGSYLATSGHEAMTATESGGSWGPASEIALPSNAASTPRLGTGLRSIACQATGPCVAFGGYTDSSGAGQVMVAEETAGSWGPASELALPANAASNPYAYPDFSPACPASGSCVAVGGYLTTGGQEEAMTATESGGSWGQASEIALPANAASNRGDALRSIACQATASCVAVGYYRDSSGNTQMMITEETGGSWGRASEIALPANAESNPGEVYIGAVECPASWSCTVFAAYRSGGRLQDMEVNGMTAPENTAAPMISGTARVGETLTCSEGTWTADPTSYTYNWLRDGSAITGAGSSTYTVQAADEGHTLTCEVTARNTAGSASAPSGNSEKIREEAREKREEEAAKKHEEEAAAAKKHQEEAAGGSGGGSGSGGSAVAGTASVGNVKVAGSTASELVSCAGPSSATCELTLTVTVTETLKGGKLVAVSASGKKGKGHPKTVKRTVTVGSETISLTGGQSEVAKVALNATGKRLLASRHKLAAQLTTIQTTSGHSTVLSHAVVTFKASGKIKHKKKG
jgi:hypothetical protein